MSKNITIAEGAQAKNFNSVTKIRTNLIGGGTQNWIPEDEAGKYANLGEASIDENGTYRASDEGLDGFSKITVNVPTESGGGGGGSRLISKTITANGTYNASSDGADGYSSVTVNVSGGSIHGQEMNALANSSIQAGETVYVQRESGEITELTPPANYQNFSYPVFYYDGYIYYNQSLLKVPYSELTATPQSTGYHNSLDRVGGHVVGSASNVYASATSLANGVTVSKQAYPAGVETANHRVSIDNEIYDENLTLLATLMESARGIPLPNNTLLSIYQSDRCHIYTPNAHEIIYVSGGSPSRWGHVLDYKFFTWAEDGNGNSTGDFGYYDFYGLQNGDTATFHKLFDCYAGSSPYTHIKVRINDAHNKITVSDTQYGVRIVNASGGYETYTNIAHSSASGAFLVGDLIFSEGHVYRLTANAIMGRTSSKNYDYLGICKNTVGASQMGTAIILFS